MTADPDAAPGFALNSNLVYRLEVGLAVMAAFYLVGLTLWLAWHGKGFFKLPGGIEAPGGEEIEDAADGLDELRVNLDEFRNLATEVLDELGQRVDEQDKRLEQVEKGSRG